MHVCTSEVPEWNDGTERIITLVLGTRKSPASELEERTLTVHVIHITLFKLDKI